MTQPTQPQHGEGRGHVVVVGRSPEKMREALDVLRSAGYTATGTFDREQAFDAIATGRNLFAVVAGGSVDDRLEVELRAAAQSRGARLVRTYIGNSNPTGHFRDHVLPQLERVRR